jgi:hypothetical protein
VCAHCARQLSPPFSSELLSALSHFLQIISLGCTLLTFSLFCCRFPPQFMITGLMGITIANDWLSVRPSLRALTRTWQLHANVAPAVALPKAMRTDLSLFSIRNSCRLQAEIMKALGVGKGR